MSIPNFMFKTWRKRYRERNYFDISDQETVDSEALVKVLKGQVTNSNSKDSVYFIVCCNGLEMLQGDETIEVDDLKNVYGLGNLELENNHKLLSRINMIY